MPHTKALIARAFIELTEIKSIDKITVKDLVERCQITRQTFYYHFQDLMDVLEWSIEQETAQTLHECLRLARPEEGLALFLRTATARREAILRLLDSQKRPHVEKMIVDAGRTLFTSMIERKNLFPEASRSDLKLAINFYTYALTGVMLDLCTQPAADIDRLASQMMQLVQGKLLDFHDRSGGRFCRQPEPPKAACPPPAGLDRAPHPYTNGTAGSPGKG